MIGGSDGKAWCREHGVAALPLWIEEIAKDLAAVRAARQRRAEGSGRWAFFQSLGTRDPRLTLSAADNMETERPKLDKIRAAIQEAGGEMFAFTNDGGPVLQPSGGWASIAEVLEELGAHGIQACLKSLPTAETARRVLASSGVDVPPGVGVDPRFGPVHQTGGGL